MRVTETVYKGKIRPWGKTRRRLNDSAAEGSIRRHGGMEGTKSRFIARGVHFPNNDGGPLDTDNYRKRVLHKLAKKLELPKLTFQVIRRSIATYAQRKGTVKDIQGVLRHSRTATTPDVYRQVRLGSAGHQRKETPLTARVKLAKRK